MGERRRQVIKNVVLTGGAAITFAFTLMRPESHPSDPREAYFDKQVQEFEYEDELRRSSPKTMFVGTSTFFFLRDYFKRNPDRAKTFSDGINPSRGLCGALVADIQKRIYRIIGPHRPKKLVLYVGANDISAGKAVHDVYRDIVNLIDTIAGIAPNTEITLLGIFPSPARSDDYQKQQELNRILNEDTYLSRVRRVQYVNAVEAFLNNEGAVNPLLFRSEESPALHPNDNGLEKILDKINFKDE